MHSQSSGGHKRKRSENSTCAWGSNNLCSLSWGVKTIDPKTLHLAGDMVQYSALSAVPWGKLFESQSSGYGEIIFIFGTNIWLKKYCNVCLSLLYNSWTLHIYPLQLETKTFRVFPTISPISPKLSGQITYSPPHPPPPSNMVIIP